MAHTAHKTEKAKQQIFDSEDILDKKVDRLAKLILQSKHFIAFTGAGISTASGIPDYRSGVNTVLKTGPGSWEKKAQNIKSAPNKNVVHMNKAIPSFTHMTLVALEEAGFLKYLISQNVDGLHMRSGFCLERLAQLHGNRYSQKCRDCGNLFLRDYKTRNSGKINNHDTQRYCEKCSGMLYDTIINFGESLPEEELNRSFEQAEKADLCLVLGSSLTVVPAANIPLKTTHKKGGKLAIVNLQQTSADYTASVRLNGTCDDVMIRLAKKMNLKVEDFVLRRIINFKLNNKRKQYQFRGVDKRGVPFSFFYEVHIGNDAPRDKYRQKLEGQPYFFSKYQKRGYIQIQFNGYLEEPNLLLDLSTIQEGNLLLQYDPREGQWTKRQWIALQKQEQKQQKKEKKQKSEKQSEISSKFDIKKQEQ